jgi:hypothetical protein
MNHHQAARPYMPYPLAGENDVELCMASTDFPLSCGAMSVDAFARWAGIGRTTAWNEIRLGRLRAVKVSARTLITLENAQTWLSSLPEVQRPNAPGRQPSKQQI